MQPPTQLARSTISLLPMVFTANMLFELLKRIVKKTSDENWFSAMVIPRVCSKKTRMLLTIYYFKKIILSIAYVLSEKNTKICHVHSLFVCFI